MPHTRLFGAIADDYTGAADLAGMLRAQGVRTALVLGLQPDEVLAGLDPSYEAVVIALKTRSIPAGEAREQSLAALRQLRELDVRQVQLKYCSTFDSTREGNIGPVIDSLMTAMQVDFTVAVPALPVNGRTQYLGHLFVGGRLLSETHMRRHPVTPMTDADLVRHLQAQTSRRVGLIALPVVREGAGSIRKEAQRLQSGGCAVALVDVVSDADLEQVADAAADLRLITGGSGLGMKLPVVWQRAGLLQPDALPPPVRADGEGGVLILAGSCSTVTLRQLQHIENTARPGLPIDVLHLLTDEAATTDRLCQALSDRMRADGWALAFSSADADERGRTLEAASRKGYPEEHVRARLERATGRIARRLVDSGAVRALVTAGGETTGAVTEALGLRVLELGDLLDPGVPVLRALGERDLTLVFKAGNFGSPDFFTKTLRRLRA